MRATHQPQLITRFRLVSQAAGIAAVVVSCVVLLGWALDIEALKKVLPGKLAMNPGGTALGFLFVGTSLYLLRSGPRHGWSGRVALVCAGYVTLAAALRLAGYWLDWDFGPDGLLFREELAAYDIPNRMAPNTAVNFLLVGLSLLLLDVRIGRTFRPSEPLALGAALISLLAIIG